MKLPTTISEVCWCDPSKDYIFESARLKLPSAPAQKTNCWLDQLLDGGFNLPDVDRGKQALGILLTGPPGTGKSTLALELAYRWSISEDPNVQKNINQILYTTLEASPAAMINNAKSYNWKFQQNLREIADLSEMQEKKVNILSFRHLSSDPTPGTQITRTHLDILIEKIIHAADKFRGTSTTTEKKSVRPPTPVRPPDVLIIDSLNSIPKSSQREALFLQYSKFVQNTPAVVIFILDSSPSDQRAEFWEFASDVVIRVDRQYDNSGYMGYMIRNIEILKARFQYHAWGRHQLKIYKGTNVGMSGIGNCKSEEELNLTEKERLRREEERRIQASAERMRSHPYRNEGGIFIFPSIHFVLSSYKHAAPASDNKLLYYEAKVPHLSKLLGNGYPMGRCTALIGERGGHKSHLGYVELLHRVVDPDSCLVKARKEIVNVGNEKALIVSLRDDEGMTRRTLTGILDLWRGNTKRVPTLVELEKQGKLEITYFPPGYITPEEFFHRLLLSINRLKHSNSSNSKDDRVTLLFNSLDQLSSRFPLCAKEPIFIPGIIQMLAGEGVSSFFVAAKEEGRSDYYGLDSMAELILDFEHRDFTLKSLYEHLWVAESQKNQAALRLDKKLRGAKKRAVVVRVGRFAGGQAAGAEGVLELIKHKKSAAEPSGEIGFSDILRPAFRKDDLVFIPRDPKSASEFGEVPNSLSRVLPISKPRNNRSASAAMAEDRGKK